MKKFTNLEEELIKEAYDAQNVFDTNLKLAQTQLERIKDLLEEIKEEYYQTDKRDWGYSGTLGHVCDKLTDVVLFLEEE